MEEAREFFAEQGFRIVKEAEPDYSKVTGIKQVMELASPEMVQQMRSAGKTHTTWMLEII